MTPPESIGLAAVLLLSATVAHADPCKLSIVSNDAMQYSAREMLVPAGCTDVEISLRHSGQLAAKVMGHDWVLARESDVSAIVNAGLAAGFKHGYLPENGRRRSGAPAHLGECAEVEAMPDTGAYFQQCTRGRRQTLNRLDHEVEHVVRHRRSIELLRDGPIVTAATVQLMSSPRMDPHQPRRIGRG
jgi:azurin